MNKLLFKLQMWFRGEILAIPGRMIALVFFVLLTMIPLVTSSPYVLRIISLASLFALFAASWDLLTFVGQVNLGHGLFFGVAAYAAALLNIHFHFSPWLTIPLGSIFAVIVGLIAGIPALRLRGFYLSLVSLSFPIILTGFLYIVPDFSGGEMGLYGLDRLSTSTTRIYYIILSIMILSSLIMWKISDAGSRILRIGVILHAIREDEITARSSGINTTLYKLTAYAISGLFAGIAGGIYAHYLRISGPSTLELFFSFQVILWAIFGGMTTIYGAITGVFILYPLIEVARVVPVISEARFIIFDLILIFTLLFMPQGLTTWVLDKIQTDCPRCKLRNVSTREYCRACRAPLHIERKKGG